MAPNKPTTIGIGFPTARMTDRKTKVPTNSTRYFIISVYNNKILFFKKFLYFF